MAVRRVGEEADDGMAILRVSIPKVLLEDIREIRKKCRDNGLVFDIKPDVTETLERALAEAKEALAQEMERRGRRRGG